MVLKPTLVKILIYYDYNMYNLTILSFFYGPINLNFFLKSIFHLQVETFLKIRLHSTFKMRFFNILNIKRNIIVILIIVQNRIFTFNTLKKVHGYL
jgi:hypothetical protein